jgi:hypothetical protein
LSSVLLAVYTSLLSELSRFFRRAFTEQSR